MGLYQQEFDEPRRSRTVGPTQVSGSNEHADVAVVGGGIVGLCVAESLARRGASVAVLEAVGWGLGASEGNAGWVSPSISNPLPAPGTMAQALRWMPDPRSPLLVHPVWSWAFARWSWDFWRSTRPPRYGAGMAALVALCDRAVADYEALADRGVRFEMHDRGLLFVACEQRTLEAELGVLGDVGAVGRELDLEVLDARRAREREPALSDRIAGAIHTHGDRHVRPETVVAGVVERLAKGGATLRGAERVRRLTRASSGWRLTSANANMIADQVVVAAGVGTVDLLAPLGVRLPLIGAKGYSITVDQPAVRPGSPLYLLEAKVGVTPFDDSLRFAGTLELGARDLRISPPRIAAIEAAAARGLRSWQPHGSRREWAGFRPLTPDGVPVLGAIPGHPGLHVATGHSMLGVTLAPTTGELIAAAVHDGGPSLELAAFSIARFDNRMPAALSRA